MALRDRPRDLFAKVGNEIRYDNGLTQAQVGGATFKGSDRLTIIEADGPFSTAYGSRMLGVDVSGAC